MVDLLVEGVRSVAAAGGDDAVLALLRKDAWFPAAAYIEPLDGLVEAEARLPRSAAVIVERLSAEFGAAAVDRLRAADARILAAVQAAARTRELLRAALGRHPFERSPIANRALQRAIDAHELHHHTVLTAFAIAETDRPGGSLDDTAPGDAARAAVGEMLYGTDRPGSVWGADDGAFTDPVLRAAREERLAVLEQQRADAHVAAGAAGLGTVVARDDGDDLTTTEVLGPVAGITDPGLAVGLARLAGVACAVVGRTSGGAVRHYLLTLSDDIDFADVRSVQTGRTEVVRAGSADVVALVTSDGHVLRTDPDGRYYSVLALPHRRPFLGRDYPDNDPAPYVEADVALAEVHRSPADSWPGEVYRPQIPLDVLFSQSALDVVLSRLARSQRKLDLEVRRFTSWQAGAALRADTDRLRKVLYESAALAFRIGDRPPSTAQRMQAATLTAEVGRIMEREPMALLYVEVDLEDGADPFDSDFRNLLDGLADGDVATRARTDIDTRIENVDTIRAHFLDEPDAARGLATLNPDVLAAFDERQRDELHLVLIGDELRELASTLGTTVLGLLPTLLAFVSPPAALVAAGLDAALGLRDVAEGFAEAELMTAMSALDVPGGFSLASAEEAASARRWAWIGLGLVAVDLWLQRADLGRALRSATTGRSATTSATESLRGVAPPPGPPPFPFFRSVPGTVLAAVTGASGAGLAAAVEAAELANGKRLAGKAFTELADEMRLTPKKMRSLIVGAVDEAARLRAAALLGTAADILASGGSATAVHIGDVVLPVSKAPRGGRVGRDFLVVGGEGPALGWGLESVAVGRRTTAVAPAKTAATEAFVANHGRFVQGSIENLPAGYRCSLAREDLPGGLADAEAFVTARVDRLALGGQWVVTTESADAATALAQVPPRPDVRMWTTEYTTFRNGTEIVRHVVVIAKPRPRTMTSLSTLVRPGTLTDARLAALMATLTHPDNVEMLQRKLGKLWHGGIVDAGRVATGHLSNLTGNIGEILAHGYKAKVLAARVGAAAPGDTPRLFDHVKRVRGTRSTDFTDGVIATERGGNAYVSDIVEVKAGPDGGQEAATQLFETMENRLQVGDRITLGGKTYVYDPAATGSGRIIGVLGAQKHMVLAKGAETVGVGSGDQVSGELVRAVLEFGGTEVNSAEIYHLAQRIIEGLPPAP